MERVVQSSPICRGFYSSSATEDNDTEEDAEDEDEDAEESKAPAQVEAKTPQATSAPTANIPKPFPIRATGSPPAPAIPPGVEEIKGQAPTQTQTLAQAHVTQKLQELSLRIEQEIRISPHEKLVIKKSSDPTTEESTEEDFGWFNYQSPHTYFCMTLENHLYLSSLRMG
jgi:hypothetical protein